MRTPLSSQHVFLAVALCLALPVAAQAAIINVPADFPDIQSAIYAAVNGDTVLVAPGIYTGSGNRDISLLGKAVRVVGDGGAEATVIDCQGLGRGFWIRQGETYDPQTGYGAAVQGFTVTHGYAAQSANGGNGGGIATEGGYPMLADLIVTDCQAYFSGGGIWLWSPDYGPQRVMYLSNITVAGCLAEQGAAIRGHGFPLTAHFANLQLTGNQANASVFDLYHVTGYVKNMLIADNTVARSEAGILLDWCAATFDNITVVNNDGPPGRSGALHIGYNAQATIRNSIIWGNLPATQIIFTPEWCRCNMRLTISNTILQGGQGQIGWPSCGTVNWGLGMLDVNPLFTASGDRPYLLSQVSAGQPSTSPAVNAGSMPAASMCLLPPGPGYCFDQLTTATNGAGDAGILDLGYHYDLVTNQPPIAVAGPDQTVEANGSLTPCALDGAQSYDPDGDPLVSYFWFDGAGQLVAEGMAPTVALPLGSHVFTLIVNDGQTDSEVIDDGSDGDAVVVITVADTTPPTVSVALDPCVLWPPNHQMALVTATVTAADNSGDIASVTLTAAVSSEPDDAPGGGDGHTRNDIQDAELGAEDYAVLLRAERDGRGQGRTYTLTYTVVDLAGNESEASGTVFVPHSLGKAWGKLDEAISSK